jgi:hypothetical protein
MIISDVLPAGTENEENSQKLAWRDVRNAYKILFEKPTYTNVGRLKTNFLE